MIRACVTLIVACAVIATSVYVVRWTRDGMGTSTVDAGSSHPESGFVSMPADEVPAWDPDAPEVQQEPLFLIGREDEWGYIDQTGRVVIEPQFYWAGEFHEGLAQVCPNDYDHGGYIDQTGEMVIEADFYSVGDFSEGLAPVQPDADDRWGYIDRRGDMVIQPQFAEAYPFSEGLAQVELNWGGGYGYIDRHGRVVIEPISESWGDPFVGGLTVFQVDDWNGPYGFIDSAGRVIVEPELEWAWSFSDGLALVAKGSYEVPVYDPTGSRIRSEEGPLYGFVNTNGELVVPLVLYDAWPFCAGLAPAQFEFCGLYGFIDTQGKIVVPPTFVTAGMFSEDGLAPVQLEVGGDWGYCDRTGEVVIEPQFWDAQCFRDGLAAVCLWPDFGYCYINTSGEIVYPTLEDFPDVFLEVDS